MDILSHGLWGSMAFGRKNRKSFWISFCFGISPDLFSFGVLSFAQILGLSARGTWRVHPPASSDIPLYVHNLYNITHSYVVFAVVFLLVLLILKRPVWEMCAWFFHIFFDMFVHSDSFFPTPIFWPISKIHVNGISWAHPYIFFTNVFLLCALYIFFFVYRKQANRKIM
jgi:hypothetical protein